MKEKWWVSGERDIKYFKNLFSIDSNFLSEISIQIVTATIFNYKKNKIYIFVLTSFYVSEKEKNIVKRVQKC